MPGDPNPYLLTVNTRTTGVVHDDTSLGAFLNDIASERVAPAGGSAVAIAGAMGAALCEMVCVHTLAARDDGWEGGDGPALARLRADLTRRRRALLRLATQDAALVDELFGGGNAGSERLRKRAAGIPLAIAEASLAVLEDAAVVFESGRAGVTADAKTGAYLADAAVRASLATARVNLETLSDQSVASEIEARTDVIERLAAAARTDVLGESFDR
jgi:formiminotetrahydrofolate cyclodeaminase